MYGKGEATIQKLTRAQPKPCEEGLRVRFVTKLKKIFQKRKRPARQGGNDGVGGPDQKS